MYIENHEAEIIAQACTESPDGRKRWTLTLLAEEIEDRQALINIHDPWDTHEHENDDAFSYQKAQ